jgi:hypothetical protein
VESFVVWASTKGAAYQRGQLETALQQVTDGITLCRQFASILPLAAELATLARFHRPTVIRPAPGLHTAH